MNAFDREQVRLSLLRYLDAAAGRRFGLSDGVMLQHVRSEGFDVSQSELTAELVYLSEKNLAKPESKEISPENRAWRITAAGRDFYAQLSA
jgi:hypothetical protein